MNEMNSRLHDERVPDRRDWWERFLDRHGHHRHYVVRTTWTLDDSPWFADPMALDWCECGATRRLWGITTPWVENRGGIEEAA